MGECGEKTLFVPSVICCNISFCPVKHPNIHISDYCMSSTHGFTAFLAWEMDLLTSKTYETTYYKDRFESFDETADFRPPSWMTTIYGRHFGFPPSWIFQNGINNVRLSAKTSLNSRQMLSSCQKIAFLAK